MNICNSTHKDNCTKYISGNLYSISYAGVCIYTNFYNTFVSLETGYSYTHALDQNWVDVTDQYCLQKVK